MLSHNVRRSSLCEVRFVGMTLRYHRNETLFYENEINNNDKVSHFQQEKVCCKSAVSNRAKII